VTCALEVCAFDLSLARVPHDSVCVPCVTVYAPLVSVFVHSAMCRMAVSGCRICVCACRTSLSRQLVRERDGGAVSRRQCALAGRLCTPENACSTLRCRVLHRVRILIRALMELVVWAARRSEEELLAAVYGHGCLFAVTPHEVSVPNSKPKP
jgi:hypothetical protein